MNTDKYVQNLEEDVLQVIEEKLASGDMDVDRAKVISKMVLDSLVPPLTLEQVHQAAINLDSHFKELSQALLPVLNEHQKEVEKVVAEHALKLINSGKFDQASSTMQKVNEE